MSDSRDELDEGGISLRANNLVLVFEYDSDGEQHVYECTTNGQVRVRAVIIRDGVARESYSCLSSLIEDGLTVDEYVDKLIREFPAVPEKPGESKED